MKKNVPIIKVNIPYEINNVQNMLLWRYEKIIKDGHKFSKRDFDIFCAISIRKYGLEKLPPELKSIILSNNIIIPDIQYHITALALENDEIIEDTELKSHINTRIKRTLEKKKIIKKEIARTGINAEKVNLDNSEYYRLLLNLIKDFDDLTLIDWYVPIELTFERFIHIYIKHVEETKFADGQFRHRSFLDYKPDELLILIKSVLRCDRNSIENHFSKKAIESATIKDYYRGFGSYPPIEFNGDNFHITINQSGKIMSFYQIK